MDVRSTVGDVLDGGLEDRTVALAVIVVVECTSVVDFHGAAAGSLGIVVTVQYVVVHKGTDHGHGGHYQHYEAYERDRFPLFPRFDIFIIDHYICPSIPAFL